MRSLVWVASLVTLTIAAYYALSPPSPPSPSNPITALPTSAEMSLKQAKLITSMAKSLAENHPSGFSPPTKLLQMRDNVRTAGDLIAQQAAKIVAFRAPGYSALETSSFKSLLDQLGAELEALDVAIRSLLAPLAANADAYVVANGCGMSDVQNLMVEEAYDIDQRDALNDVDAVIFILLDKINRALSCAPPPPPSQQPQ